jgi:hypothetical protein
MELKKSTTSQIVQVFFLDTTSVIGAGKIGLAYNTSGLTCYYKRNKASASAAVTLASMTLGSYTDGGFQEVDATHMPGLYEFGVPDAALATGADGSTEVTVMFALSGHEAVTRPLRFDLIALDKQDSVRAGLSALPNAAAGASGGLRLDDPLAQPVPGDYTAGTAGSKLGLLGSGTVTVSAPVSAQSGDLSLIRGDDYTLSSGRAVPEWSSDDWTAYSLTTATSIRFKAQARYGDTTFEKAGAAVSDTLVRVELTSAETSGLAVGRAAYRFDLEAVLASGDVVTLAQGHITVIEDVA